MSWPNVPLSELAAPTAGSFVDGPFGSSMKASEYQPDGVPVIRLQNVRPNEFLAKEIKFISLRKASELSRHSYAPGDVVISKLGDPPGYACVLPPSAGSGVIVADVVRFRGNPRLIDHRYLSYYLNSPVGRQQFLKLSKGTTRTRVNLSNIKTIEIPLPPLDEQKRIAAVLDKAEALRRQRQESLDLTEKLLQSVFLEMFVKNPEVSHWTPQSIEWMAKDAKGSIRTGPFGSQLLHSEFVDQGIAVLGIDNAVKNRFEWGQPRFITPKKYEDLRRYKVFPGDLIITIMGTVGRCAIVPDDIPEAINTKHLCCLTLNPKKCLPEFLHAAFLNHPDILRQLGVRAKGAVMPGLNMGIIKELEIPMPPVELQETFKKIVTSLTASRMHLETSLDVAGNLFSSLQQRAFRGELDLSRLVLDAEATEPEPKPDEIPVPEQPPKSLGRATGSASFKVRSRRFIPTKSEEARLKVLDAQLERGEPIDWSPDYFRFRLLGRQAEPFRAGDILQQAATVFNEETLPKRDELVKQMLGMMEGVGEVMLSGALLKQRFDTERHEIRLELVP